jgi:tetratricopeptide (TPR) repeat protein
MLLDAVVAFEKGAPDADYLIHRLIHRTSNVPSLMLQGLLLDARRWLVLGNPEEANEIIEKVLRMDLRNVAAAGWRAEAFRRLGSPEMALGATARPAIAKAASPLRDAIRIRVLVDLGRLEEAQIALEQHPLPFSVETLASSWYLARALGDDQAVQEAEELWAVINLDAGRQLRSLIPANSEAN